MHVPKDGHHQLMCDCGKVQRSLAMCCSKFTLARPSRQPGRPAGKMLTAPSMFLPASLSSHSTGTRRNALHLSSCQCLFQGLLPIYFFVLFCPFLSLFSPFSPFFFFPFLSFFFFLFLSFFVLFCPSLSFFVLFCPSLSFFVLFCPFRDFPDSLRDGPGIFPIRPFSLSRPSTYEEQSRKGPRHNLDLSRKRREAPRFSFSQLLGGGGRSSEKKKALNPRDATLVLSGPLNRLNAALSLLQPLDRYRNPSAIGSAIGRAYLALCRFRAQLGALNRLVLNRLGGSTAR